ncbi:hypothetical protein V2J09_005026 [Rumex salicifolius]
MGVLGESWCFCGGGGKSERLKATIFSNKSAAMVSLSSAGAGAGEATGSGFLMHKNLLLTTHVNLPSASAAESTEIRLQNGVVATLLPQRFFITSSVLDLTIVGLDSTEGESSSLGPQPHYLKTNSNPNLDLGSVVYVLGYTTNKELTIGEGKVIIATDNLIKLSPYGLNWSPGSAGFDSQGNLAFMICDPMKLATSPYTKSSSPPKSASASASSASLFGIPMPIICGWMNQHLEAKQPLMRSVSVGNRSEHPSESSLITNQIFKASDVEDLNDSSSSNVITRSHEEVKAVVAEPFFETQEILTLERYESPKATIVPKETSLITLSVHEDPIQPQSSKDENLMEENAEVSSSGSANVAQNEVGTSPTHSQEKEAMNSAETAESRSNSSPREESLRESTGRDQRGVMDDRWGVHKYHVASKSSVEKRSGLIKPRKSVSQGTTSRRSNEYCSPTVSSIKKKMNADLEKAKPATRTRQTVVSSSPRWVI